MRLRAICRPSGREGLRPGPRAGGRTTRVLGAVLRPGGLHPAVRVARSRGRPRAAVPLLRGGQDHDRPLRRNGREVHRRRGDGRVGDAHRVRGRRRTRRPGRAGPGGRGGGARGRGRRARPGRPRGRGDRRDGGQPGRGRRGHGGRGRGQHRGPGAGCGRTGAGADRRVDAAAGGPGGRVRRRRRAPPEGQGRAAAAVAGHPGALRDRRPAADGRARGPAGRAATRSCARSRNCSTPAPSGRSRAWSWYRARPGSASRGWAGSSEKYIDGLADEVCGTGAAAFPTARAWRSGRWPRSSASGWASPRRTRPRPPQPSSTTGLDRFVPEASERAYVGNRLGRLLGVSRPRGPRRPADPGGAVRRVAAVLRAPRRGRPGRAGHRGRPVRRHRAARLPGSSRRLGPRPADLRAGIRPYRAAPGPPGFGVGRNRTTLTFDPLDGPRWTGWWMRWCRACRRRREPRSPTRRRASRCSRWRRSAP